MKGHDHVVPRDVIRREILKMLGNKSSDEQLYEFLDKNLIGCVITKEEDNMLNRLGLRDVLGCTLDNHTTWKRYEVARISRKKVKW
ncbi:MULTISPECIES: hypothetical protein [Halobacillus]|uniref:hypothetical protein n=1 Tax=Halobacillus TaxID=45667 RepID=UPI0009A6D3E8|nr:MULTISPECIES: hypothetical protein [Halobacillus]